MSRATRPVPTPVEMETPNSIHSRAAREENRSLDHLTHPDHRHAVYGVIPQHSHVPHHTHIRPPRPLASRPLPSQVHPVVYVHRQTEELREPRGVASEQLIVPRTPPTDGNNDNQFPPAFHSLGSSLFHMDGSRPRVPQADIGTRLHASEAGPNSSLTPSALSSLVHPTPPSSTYVTSRADAPSTLSSIQNEMAIRNNHQFATNLTIEHTEMPHQPVHPDATGYSHVPPQADTARSRGQDTNVRWRMRSSSIPVRDDVSRQNTGPMYPWMAQ
ncbi:hypothetical protein PISMIDRAFT_287597 [Pisolithus microcarpus 441]|uniref:Uncharacterized protein n=1 Tax=Pisolithus microcarpus 441 TaxID=765257 RepID=A0A0C9ZVI4_9AGAM|nr:hypothetical protein BKA83DRAFT_4243829 [Pisolithus microcarpus]KIK26237.1 hypothetical protein PISMIDRAFT_287597 [Pisolithus microcarpus 441]